MSNISTYVDDMMLAVQFVIHAEFIDIAHKLGVFDAWEKMSMEAECMELDDGTGRVVLTISGPVDNILQIEKDIRAAELPDDTMLWHEAPFGPLPCAIA